MYTLFYNKLESESPVELKFTYFDDMIGWMEMLFNSVIQEKQENGDYTDNIVYLYTHKQMDYQTNGDVEILVTQDLQDIYHVIGHDCFAYEMYETYYLQEYSSYEDAYEVALLMREENPLCKSKKA